MSEVGAAPEAAPHSDRFANPRGASDARRNDPRERRAQRRHLPRRAAEQRWRECVVAVVNRCRPWVTKRQACQALGISPRTVRHWRLQRPGPLQPRGRPLKTVPVSRRQEVVRFLHKVTGPVVGLPALGALFPAVPRCVLADLLQRYRQVWRWRYRRQGFRLTWHRPGSVWAMDHSRATQLIDGKYEQIFAVRDLASHRQLAWLPVTSTGAEEACPALEALLAAHGPPLVMKSDQGSTFVGEGMGKLLRKWQATPLLSPKGRPQYNGALERSNSTHKTYTHQQAIGEGHPNFWTTENLQSAQQLANTITRPWGSDGASPDDAWQQREPITAAERRTFQNELEKQRTVARVDLGLERSEELTPVQCDRLDRRAISLALESLGYVSMHPVRRTRRKPKRRNRAQLQRALKQQREQEAGAAAELRDDARVDVNESLASQQCNGTMRASTGDMSTTSTTSASESTQRGSAEPNVLEDRNYSG